MYLPSFTITFEITFIACLNVIIIMTLHSKNIYKWLFDAVGCYSKVAMKFLFYN